MPAHLTGPNALETVDRIWRRDASALDNRQPLMAPATAIDTARLSRELGIDPDAIARTVALLDAGNTVPFITRYRRDETGGLDEEQIGRIRNSVAKLRQLEERKQTILRSIESQHKLTDELRVADRAGRQRQAARRFVPAVPAEEADAGHAGPRARARAAGRRDSDAGRGAVPNLDARAADFVNADKRVPDAATALFGRRPHPGRAVQRAGRRAPEGPQAVSQERPAGEREDRATTTRRTQQFHDYLDFREPLHRIPPHRVLAINRGERANVLRVKIEADEPAIEQLAIELLRAARASAQGFSRRLRARTRWRGWCCRAWSARRAAS